MAAREAVFSQVRYHGIALLGGLSAPRHSQAKGYTNRVAIARRGAWTEWATKGDRLGQAHIGDGGAGFLGSHLCEYLLTQDHEVLCLDNFYTGRKGNVSHLLANPLFEVIRHDVTFPVYLEVDEICNLACPASPVHYQLHPVQTTKACVHGSINMLGLAKRLGIRILQASTSEVYGDPSVHPQVESYWGHVNPVGIRSCYDEAKRCAETLFFDYRRQYDLSIRVARIFNTYGPRMLPNDGRVISNFIVQALSGSELTVYGDGTQTRSFCYVDDLVRGLVEFMALEDDDTGPVNLGNPRECTIEEIARLIIAEARASADIVHEPLPSDDPSQRQPDIRYARELLGWEPVVQLEEGLARTVAYFRATLGADLTRRQSGQDGTSVGGHNGSREGPTRGPGSRGRGRVTDE